MERTGKTVLAVDDDPDVLSAIELMLDYAGYSVSTATKGEYAENLHNGNGGLPDLIVLDMLLSGADGRLICKALKNRADTRHIPIIIMSAHPDARDSAMEAGADDFLAKPFEMDALLDLAQKYTTAR